ncbi:MAG: type II secretion system F family protein [Anaerohalosphaeraceae bacterium]
MADFRINLYQNLSTLLSAGLPILRALHTVQNNASGRWKKHLAQIEQEVGGGYELSEAMSRRPRYFARLDISLTKIGEQTGQLAEVLNSLAEWYELRRKLKHLIYAGLAYPVFIIHVAALILPIPLIALSGMDWSTYLPRVLNILSFFYVPVIFMYLICRLFPREGAVRRIFDELFLGIPLIGSALRCLAMGRFCYTFSIMYKAGVPIIECALLSHESCGNEAIKRRLKGGYDAARNGTPMSQGFNQNLDTEFLELWNIGEESGNLDKTSEKLGQIYIDKARFRFELIANWAPKLVYFSIMGVMAYMIIKLFSQIYSSIPTEF